jgi:F0F1-type ATP synthase membrane subunit b/b'
VAVREQQTTTTKEVSVAIGQQTSPPDGSAVEQAQEKVQEVGHQAQQQAQKVAGQARDRIRGQVDQRSTQAGEQIAGQAGDMRTVADQLREQGKDKPAQLAEQAARQAERMASYLKESGPERMLGDAERLARQRPWAVVAGGIALGFAASRFLKASSAERYREPVPQGRAALPRATDAVTGQQAHGMGSQPGAMDGGDRMDTRSGTGW